MGSDTADAASITLSTSFPVISPLGSEIATTPWEFWECMWAPPMATYAESRLQPAILSAASTEEIVASTASSISTTCPFLIPFESTDAAPTTFIEVSALIGSVAI